MKLWINANLALNGFFVLFNGALALFGSNLQSLLASLACLGVHLFLVGYWLWAASDERRDA